MNTFLRLSAFFGALLVISYGFAGTTERADQNWLLMLLGAGILLAFSWWPRATRGLPIFNRTVLRWATIILVCFALVSVQLVRVQVVESARTVNRVGESPDGEVVSNPRLRARSLDVQRGRILDRNGNVLADSVQLDDGTWARIYPTTDAAGLLGYYSPGLFGSTNIERAYDDYLSGIKGGNAAEDWLNGVLHKDQRGYDVELTIDLALQHEAVNLLAGRPGAVILMDAHTGEVLAMAGAPTFDPNRLYANVGQQTQDQIDAIQQYWSELNASEDAPLIFRPTQGLYNPGSTFKTVTASALVDTGKADLNTVYRDEGILEVDGRVIEETNRPDPNQVNFTLEQAYAYSLNVVFAQIGLQLGSDTLWDYAQRFGIGKALDFDIPTTDLTQIASSRDALNNRALLADTGFGQGEILVSPLDMALVVATIANGGVRPHPYVVDSAQTADGEVMHRFDHGHDTRVIAPESAAMVQDLMRATATYGAAQGIEIPSATIGGKTGTAEVGNGEPHSWFIGYAQTEQRTYAVAVIVEHGGPGSQVAMPIGAEMLRLAVENQGGAARP